MPPGENTLGVKRERFIRVGGAEDKEGASLWNGGDFLLLHQIGDDWPRP